MRVGENFGNIPQSFSAKQQKNNSNLRNDQILWVFFKQTVGTTSVQFPFI